MLEINGLHWFIGILVSCTWLAHNFRAWRRETRQYRVWWQQYEERGKQRHVEFLNRTNHISRMIGVFAAACSWRNALRAPDADVKTFEKRLIAAVDASRAARKKTTS